MDQVEITLIGPAKVNGRFRKPGDTVTVDETVRDELAGAGVIHSDFADVARDVKDSGDIRAAIALELGKRAVATAVKERDAHWSTALDHFQSMAEDEKEEALQTVAGEHRAELEVVDRELDAAKARIGELDAKVADLEASLVAETDRANAAEAALAAAGVAGSGTAGKAGKPAK